MRTRDPEFKKKCLIGLGLAVITLVLYLPVLRHSFIEYDDQQYVTDNPRVQTGLTWAGLVWAFGFHAGNWHPLAWLSHMLDCQIYDARAGGHHLTNVLLHVGSTVLLFLVLNRMTRLRSEASARQAELCGDGDARPTENVMWCSAAVAALFAWHPLHVESVAWVAERKDVLCAFFWMLTLWFYAGYAERSKIQNPKSKVFYAATLFAFVLCLMAKPMGVTLPFVLLLLDYWPLRRVECSWMRVEGQAKDQQRGAGNPSPDSQPSTISRLSTLLIEKIPFFALAAGACILTVQAQQIAIVSTDGLTMSHRITHTVVAYNHYFWAMFFPHNLSVYYPYVIKLDPEVMVFSSIVLVLFTLLALKNIRRRPWFIVGWLWFLGTLVPVIGLMQVGDQAWADRYTYLPLIGLFIPLVWFANEAVKNRRILQGMAGLAATALLTATAIQLAHWKNTWTLFDHANKVTKENYMAITVLASQLAKQDKLAEAIALYNTALSYKPTFPETHFFLGNAFDQLGRPEDAVAEYEKALWFKPTQEQAHIFLGIVLGKQKKYAAAITNYQAALVLNPDSAVTHNNLARIYHTQGQLDEAIEHYTAALNIDPRLALAHNNLGILLLQKGGLTDGTLQLREALRLNPTNSETQFNLALALNQQEQWSEAAELFQKTAAAYRADPKAHYEFGRALAHLKKTRQAMSEYAAALLAQPDFPDALDGLAWILATDSKADFRNGTEAVNLAENACTLTGRNDPVKLKTLAAAYAETGRFAEASQTIQSAKALAAKTNRPQLVNECEAMQEAFQQSKAWRGSP